MKSIFKNFKILILAVTISLIAGGVMSYAITLTQTRYSEDGKVMGTMTFDKKNNLVSGARNITVKLNPHYYTGRYFNTYKKAKTQDGQRSYMLVTAGTLSDMFGFEKQEILFSNIYGYK